MESYPTARSAPRYLSFPRGSRALYSCGTSRRCGRAAAIQGTRVPLPCARRGVPGEDAQARMQRAPVLLGARLLRGRASRLGHLSADDIIVVEGRPRDASIVELDL